MVVGFAGYPKTLFKAVLLLKNNDETNNRTRNNDNKASIPIVTVLTTNGDCKYNHNSNNNKTNSSNSSNTSNNSKINE